VFKQPIVIREVHIDPPVAIAPMVGISHSAFRTLLHQLGGVGLLYTEMLAARRLPHDNPNCSPLLVRSAGERPLFYQITTANEDEVAKAVEKLHELKAEGIDLNLGCPAPLIVKQGAGQALFENMGNLVKILRKIRGATKLPLGVKIRLGKGPEDNAFFDRCRLFEDEGVDVIAVHARYLGEKFCRKPRWSEIARIKEMIKLPILANGGIFSVKDARHCLAQSGADGLMIGRGAAIRPTLCREVAENVFGLKYSSNMPGKEEIVAEFIKLLENRFAPERRLGRLKQFISYFGQDLEFGHQLITAVQNSSSLAIAKDRALHFFDQKAVQ
jgi:tRNA-dihydrouridine synthase B